MWAPRRGNLMTRLPRPRSLYAVGRALAVLLCAALLLGGTIRPALAHALYEKSQPATGSQLEAPGQIQVWFTEDVEPEFSRLEVLDTSRRRVDLDDSHGVLGTGRA